MIAYGAVQKAIHGLSFVTDMELLDKCIGVLSYCAQKDAMAERFRVLLSCQLDELQKLHVLDGDLKTDPVADRLALHRVLFDFDSGSSKLHNTARKLLHLIHRPFAGLSEIKPKATLSNRAETTMGTHLEWAWEFKDSNNFEKVPEPEIPHGTSVGILDGAIDPLLPSAGAPWSMWTPPVRN
jgi:hypothetical protein